MVQLRILPPAAKYLKKIKAYFLLPPLAGINLSMKDNILINISTRLSSILVQL